MAGAAECLVADNALFILGYMKAVKSAMNERNASAEEITAFEKGAQGYVKEKLLPNFKDFEFYTGESMNPDGLYVFDRQECYSNLMKFLDCCSSLWIHCC